MTVSKVQKLGHLGVDRTSQSSVPVQLHLYSESNLPQGPQAQAHGERGGLFLVNLV